MSKIFSLQYLDVCFIEYWWDVNLRKAILRILLSTTGIFFQVYITVSAHLIFHISCLGMAFVHTPRVIKRFWKLYLLLKALSIRFNQPLYIAANRRQDKLHSLVGLLPKISKPKKYNLIYSYNNCLSCNLICKFEICLNGQ